MLLLDYNHNAKTNMHSTNVRDLEYYFIEMFMFISNSTQKIVICITISATNFELISTSFKRCLCKIFVYLVDLKMFFRCFRRSKTEPIRKSKSIYIFESILHLPRGIDFQAFSGHIHAHILRLRCILIDIFYTKF